MTSVHLSLIRSTCVIWLTFIYCSQYSCALRVFSLAFIVDNLVLLSGNPNAWIAFSRAWADTRSRDHMYITYQRFFDLSQKPIWMWFIVCRVFDKVTWRDVMCRYVEVRCTLEWTIRTQNQTQSRTNGMKHHALFMSIVWLSIVTREFINNDENALPHYVVLHSTCVGM